MPGDPCFRPLYMAQCLRTWSVGTLHVMSPRAPRRFVMQDRFARSIREGMEVVTFDGDKIGSIDAIFQPTAVRSTAARTGEAAGESRLKVKSGLLGFGSEYYIPTSAVRDVTKDRVILSVEKDKLESRGWDKRPAWITD